MSGPIIITGGDERYFPLMQDCLTSLAASGRLNGAALGVLDCGLSAGQRLWCERLGAHIVEPIWDVHFAQGLAVADSFRAMTARPHLPRYFPGFDVYLWLDADVWVQDGTAIDLFIEAAALGDIAIVPEVHRSYANFRDGREDFETVNGMAYRQAFGDDAAERLIRRPLNNAGVFAMRSSSKAWAIWAELLADAATRSSNMIDQIALNVAIYDRGLAEVRLPARCNWISHLATPAWHPACKCLVEPDPPFEAIGIVHMTLDTKWQSHCAFAVAGRRGETINRPVRYSPKT
ncbi:MAG: hypothetical protein R3D67_21260 [Hyphomicrobiaceae bacterium]